MLDDKIDKLDDRIDERFDHLFKQICRVLSCDNINASIFAMRASDDPEFYRQGLKKKGMMRGSTNTDVEDRLKKMEERLAATDIPAEFPADRLALPTCTEPQAVLSSKSAEGLKLEAVNVDTEVTEVHKSGVEDPARMASTEIRGSVPMEMKQTETAMEVAEAVSTPVSATDKESSIKLHKAWIDEVQKSRSNPAMSNDALMDCDKTRRKSLIATHSIGEADGAFESETVVHHTGFRRCLINPSKSPRLTWDVCGMLLIAYDAVWLPFALSFEPSRKEATVLPEYMFWVTLLFWSVDMVLTFLTGYYANGKLVLQHKKIARNYMTTWFLPDVAILSLDWVSVFADSGRQGTSLVRLGKSFRTVRILRALRLLRLAKLRAIMQEIQDRIASEAVLIGMSVIKLILVLVISCHFIACVWWGLGRSNPERSWIQHNEFEDEGLAYKYWSSMHWTLTQFTPASMEIHPRNASERAFAVSVLLFAMVFFSSFISSITAAMTQLRKLNHSSAQQFSLLRRFLRQQDLPSDLSIRIKRYLEKRVAEKQHRLREKDVGILSLLSPPLQKELKEHKNKARLCVHPFFEHYSAIAPEAVRHICHSALHTISLSEGDTLFSVGSRCKEMLFLLDGALLYHSVDPITKGPSVTKLKEGTWCCEGCLWTDWVYAGSMEVVTNSKVLAVDAAKFISAAKEHSRTIQKTVQYAQKFVEDLNDNFPSSVTDLPKSKEETEEIVMTVMMDPEENEAMEAGKTKAEAWLSKQTGTKFFSNKSRSSFFKKSGSQTKNLH
eukprot:gnl/MRDRNA2_/MRDRNA2_102110_c0_seq1.p1 gnl/MRDRNA2_/MRDRNA2_102110_c0~~gnl/MRDRNA2_/MRDRNA2_102110_c0_seq1.p1  ORF type:complete len:838 (-),score=130.33 gnl/MRDRNA2_/MRDRNA2_102110_c0_seq1:534-2873(-)